MARRRIVRFFSKSNSIFHCQKILQVILNHLKWFDKGLLGANIFQNLFFKKDQKQDFFRKLYRNYSVAQNRLLFFFYVAAFYQYQGSCKKPSHDSNVVLEEPMKSPKPLCYNLRFWPQNGCMKEKLCFSPNVTQFFSTKSLFGHNLKCSEGSNSLKTPIFFSRGIVSPISGCMQESYSS